MENKPISEADMRKLSAKYMTAAFEASGLERKAFCLECGLPYSKSLKSYMRGQLCPSVDKLLRVYDVTGLRPDTFGIPLLHALELAQRMRQLFREGHTMSEFVKALYPLSRLLCGKILANEPVVMHSLAKFEFYWMQNDVENLIANPEFQQSCAKSAPRNIIRRDFEREYIRKAWGALAENAREIRPGLWEWETEEIYRMELEHLEAEIYEFRSYYKPTNELSTKREVRIA